MDADIFVSGKKKLRIQKYPDTCGRGLSQFGGMEVDLMGRRSHRPFLGGRGWGSSILDLQILDLQRLASLQISFME